MRRAGKWLLWGLGIFVALVTVAYTVAWATFNDQTLGRFISEKVEKVDRGTFHLGVAHYPYFGGLSSVLLGTPTHVYGRDYQLRDPDGNLVIEVPEVKTEVYLQELVVSLGKYVLTRKFHLTLHFRHAHIAGGMAVITPTRSTWNAEKPEVNLVAAMSPKEKLPPSGGELRIVVDDLTIDDVHFAIGFPDADGKVAWYARTEGGARAHLVYSSRLELESPDGPYFFFQVAPLHAPSAELVMGDYRFPITDLGVVEFGPQMGKREELRFRGSGRSLGAEISVAGALTSAYSEHPGVQMTLDFRHGGKLLEKLPPPLSTWLGGDPHGQVRFSGPFSHVVISGDVADVSANLNGLAVSRASGHLVLDEGILKIDPIAGRAAGGQVGASVEVGLTPPAYFKAHLTTRGVDPAKMPILPLALRLPLGGRLDGSLNLRGGLDGKSLIYVQGIDAVLERARPGMLPKRIAVTGALDWEPTRVRLRDLTASGEGLKVAASGTFNPESGRIASELHVTSGSGASWTQRLGAPKSLHVGEAHLDGTVGGTVRRPTLSAHLTASGVTLSARPLERVEAKVRLADGEVHVEDLHGTGMGASLSGEATLGLLREDDATRLRDHPTLHLRLKGHGLSMAQVTTFMGIDGIADFSLALDGPLADPRGEARFTLPHLSLAGDAYQGGLLTVALGGGGARIETLKLDRVKGGTLRGSGRLGWDQSLDLQISPQHFPLAAIPGITGLPVSLAGTLSGDLQVGGDTHNPLIGGLISLAAFKVRETMFGGGHLKLVPGADAIAIRGDLFGKVSVDGYLTLFPKLTVTATLKFNDVELERIFPEMKQLAEVSGTASGEARISFNGESGLTFAGLRLTKVRIALENSEEEGHSSKMVVRNQDDVLLSTDGNVLKFDRAHLTSALGDFYVLGQVSQKDSNVHLHGNIDLVLLEYFFRSAFKHTHGTSSVDLLVKGDLSRPQLTGWLNMENAELQPEGLDHKIFVPQGRILFTQDRMTLQNLSVRMDGAVAQASGWVALRDWVPEAVSGRVSGELSPRIFQLLLPDSVADATGRIGVDVQVGGTWSEPEWSGQAVIRGATGKLRSFPHDLGLTSGTLTFTGHDIYLGCGPNAQREPLPGCQSIAATYDDQPVTIDGLVGIANGGLGALKVRLRGTELPYSLPGEFSIAFSPDVTIASDGGQLVTSGQIDLTEGRYFHPFDIINQVVLKPRTVERSDPFWVGIPRLETMRLALRVQSTGPLYIKIPGLADLSMKASIDFTGTLSEPRLNGTIQVDPGGSITIPGVRIPFTSEAGLISFSPDRKIPDETPTLDITGTGIYTDANDTSHTLFIHLGGTISDPQMVFSSQEGWDPNAVLQVLLTGQTPEENRRAFLGQPSVNQASGTGGSATENVMKSVTGLGVGAAIANPISRVFGFDSSTVEFGTSSFDVKLCKRFGRSVKACGLGQVGFGAASRGDVSLSLKLSDWFSILGSFDYTTQNVDTVNDSLSRGRLELKLQFPLGY